MIVKTPMYLRWMTALTVTTFSMAVAGCMPEEALGNPDFEEAWGDQTSGIVNGSIDYGHPFVGQVYGSGYCTGTLIGPRTVLTAAHCISYAYATDAFTLDGVKVYSGLAVVHPGYNPATLDNDVAVIQLNTLVSGVSPAGLGFEAPRAGQSITLVGYGATNGTLDGLGTKRQGTNSIDAVASQSFTFSGSTGNESATCSGDSGGPSFNSKNQRCVIGITSNGPTGCSGSGANIQMRVDVFMSWIKQNSVGTLPVSCDPTPPICGDRICEGTERDTCRYDCGYL